MTRLALFALASVAGAMVGCRESSSLGPGSRGTTETPEWQLLASDLPSALLSVSGRSPSDIYTVGADKGDGPLVLHFDGKTWTRLHTGQVGDLWWVQTLSNGPALMAGAGAMILRFDGQRFERLPTHGLARQTVYGVWGKTADDFYAVGNAAGRDGFIWHYHGGTFENDTLPLDLPRIARGEVPGLYKVWGSGDDVWVVGAGGTILHRKAAAPFTVVPSGTSDALFTVHGNGERLLVVGGGSNGVVLEATNGTGFHDVAPTATGLIQGVFVSGRDGDWASGERGFVYSRPNMPPSAQATTQPSTNVFSNVDHGLSLPEASSLHSIFVDGSGGVWSAGGNVLTSALDSGVLIHYGDTVPPVVLEEDNPPPDAGTPAVCSPLVVAAGRTGTVARRWDEQALAAIRVDTPRPTVHARNLFHTSAAMWDAWAGYDTVAAGVFVQEHHTAPDIEKARRAAISYAAYGVLVHRYRLAVGARTSLACLQAVMGELGYDPNDTHATGDDPIAFGNRIAHALVASAANDGANEASGYADASAFKPANPALAYDNAGTTLTDPERWQPLNLSTAASPNGIPLPPGVQRYVGSQWGEVTPFAMKRKSADSLWHDPGPVPRLGPKMKDWLVDVIRKTNEVGFFDATIDTSPGRWGHNSLGATDGKGWPKNPVTGEPYASQVVPAADFARVMAEFWAEGPHFETPPGYWNTIANQVSDSPGFRRRLFGKGEPVDPLAWDVHVYLALNAAEHDAAIAAWATKRRFATVRPISLIRWMGGKGQSSDPKGPSYDPDGLPLVPGLIEVVTNESSQPGARHANLALFVGKVAVKDWLGEPGDRRNQVSGTGWVRAVQWTPYQRRTFVTPACPGFISGESTFGRAGAEVLASLTGSPYFPGGLGEIVAPKDTFLTVEKGPSVDVHMQWASYDDAADEAGQSSLWGGIHIAPDDYAGRRIGRQVGLDAVALASTYFDGSARR